MQEGRAIHTGLALQIPGMATASRPITFKSTKSITIRLTAQGIRHGSMVQRLTPPFGVSNKRKSWEITHVEDEESDPRCERYEGNDSGSEEYDDSNLEPEESGGYVLRLQFIFSKTL